MRKPASRTCKIGDDSTNLQPLFEQIVASIPPPAGDPEGVLQIQVTNLDYSDFLGRLAIARVFQRNAEARHGSGHLEARQNDSAHQDYEALHVSRPGPRRSRASCRRRHRRHRRRGRNSDRREHHRPRESRAARTADDRRAHARRWYSRSTPLRSPAAKDST